MRRRPARNWKRMRTGSWTARRRRRPSPNLRQRLPNCGVLSRMAHTLRRSGDDTKWRELDRILDDPLVLDPQRRRTPQDRRLHRGPRHARISRRTDSRPDRRARECRDHPWQRPSRPPPRDHRRLQRRSHRPLPPCQRCCRRGREPPARRPPDGQLRPAVEPQSAGATLRAHSQDRTDRGLPPLESAGERNARRRCLSAAAWRSWKPPGPHLGGKVYDVLGELFEARPLRELFMEAIRYGEQPEIRRSCSRRSTAR